MKVIYSSLVTAFLLRFTRGQETSFITEISPTTTQVATHTVEVGKGGHTFSPDTVLANVGDVIEFDFFPPNHSVVRAAYEHPCVPYEMMGPQVGFFSGFHPVDAVLDDPPKWQVVVNDTEPIFYYCSAPGSCITYGMVGVINPNASTSLAIQRQLAMNSTFMLEPGEDWPAEAPTSALPSPLSPIIPPTTSTLPTSTSPPAQTTIAAPAATTSSSLSTGAIAGIAIGAAALAIIAGFVLWYCGRNSRRRTPPPSIMTEPKAPPPGYVSSPYPGSPMSPSNKHLSTVSTVPMYQPYPYADQGHMAPFGAVQGWTPQTPPPHGAPNSGLFPPSAAFGGTTSPQHMTSGQSSDVGMNDPQAQHPVINAGIVEAATAMSRGSPSPPPVGISNVQAFLQRQRESEGNGRMSPSDYSNDRERDAGAQADSGGGGGGGMRSSLTEPFPTTPTTRDAGPGPASGPGPYEMSASRSTTRPGQGSAMLQRHVRS